MTEIRFTQEARTAILKAVRYAVTSGCCRVEPPCLAKVLLNGYPDLVSSLLREMGVSERAFRNRIEREMDGVPKGRGDGSPEISTELNDLIRSSAHDGTITHDGLFRSLVEEYRPTAEPPVPSNRPSVQSRPVRLGGLQELPRFAKNMNDLVREGKILDAIGREDEIREVMTALLRKDKCNPVLVGKAGVGKTAIVGGLVHRIVRGDVPEGLRQMQVYRLDVASLMAGASARGEFEQRVQSLLAELEGHPEIVVFIDEFHELIGAGGAAMDAENMLKPAMARGEVKIVGATTDDEYREYVEGDKAFERRLMKIRVEELSPEMTERVLRGVKPFYESFHGVTVDGSLLHLVVRLTEQYVPYRRQPDKSIDLMDESMARARLEGKTAVDEDLLRCVLEKWTGIPASRLGESEAEALQGLEDRLSRRVLGQPMAYGPVASAVRRNMLHISDGTRPIGSFLFVGPTGVGKTEMAKALAEEVFGSRENFLRIDMSEYQEPHTVSRLFGSPPGYVGYDQGGQLTEAVRQNPHMVVLLDEIEKAHPRIFDAFLQVFDAGRMTDGQGRVVDFRHCIVIMTSNLGSRELAGGRTRVGFTTTSDDRTRQTVVDEAVRAFFRPEFLNRLDAVIHFLPLDRDLLERIAAKQLDELKAHLAEEGYDVKFGEGLAPWIAAADAQPAFGARPIRRAIERHVLEALSQAFLGQRDAKGVRWEVVLLDGNVVVRRNG